MPAFLDPSNTDLTNTNSEVDELIKSKPNFLVRWGISVLFVLFIVLISITWFIKYDDAIVTTGMIKYDTSFSAKNYYVSITIPDYYSDPLKQDQEITLKFSEPPFKKSGDIKGKIKSLDTSSSGKILSAKVLLSPEFTGIFKTDSLHYHLERETGIVVTTASLRLLKRIFKNLKNTEK